MGPIGANLFYLGEVGRGNLLELLNNLVALTIKPRCARSWRWPTDSVSPAVFR